MKKKTSTINKTLANMQRLTPFVGFLFIISGIIGLIFVQKPLGQSQELRSNALEVKQCGETCYTNAECAINLRCYNKECRLAINPDSPTCSQEENAKQTVAPTNKPLKKGDNLIPKTENHYEDFQNTDPTTRVNAILNEEVPVNETVLDLIIKMLKDKQQSLPTSIILIGVGLLVVSLVTLLVKKLTNSKTKKLSKEQN